MERVGIREMRQNLSRYARRAGEGEVFALTDRGVEVARLVPAPSRASAVDRLVEGRAARRGVGDLADALETLPEPDRGPLSERVLDDVRAERH